MPVMNSKLNSSAYLLPTVTPRLPQGEWSGLYMASFVGLFDPVRPSLLKKQKRPKPPPPPPDDVSFDCGEFLRMCSDTCWNRRGPKRADCNEGGGVCECNDGTEILPGPDRRPGIVGDIVAGIGG